jgi:hypothetical protein
MASTGGLREMLEGHRSDTDAFDSAKALGRWKDWVDSLYTDVERWLSWLPEKGGRIERVRLTRYEELLGQYDIDGLLVMIDGREFFFDPRAKETIGANGRIELYEVGRVENSALLLYFTDDQDKPGTWEIRRKTDRHLGVPLNEQSLDQLLGQMLSAQ